MTGLELRKMNRRELLAMLLSMTQKCNDLEEQLEHTKKQLDERRIEIANAGSMAEAVLSINRVAEAADAAGAQYLENIRSMYDNQEELRRSMMDATKERCFMIEEETRKRCADMVESARQESEAFWSDVREWMGKYSDVKDSLQDVIRQLPTVEQ